MRKLFIFIGALFITVSLLGQAPASFKYQSVLRDSRGNFRANTSVNLRIDIIQGSVSGVSVFSENHGLTTDGYGLINLEIGNGIPTKGTLSAINWGTGTYFIKIFVDGIEMGTSQLLSVPYALHAQTAEKISGPINYTETDPVFIIWNKSSGINITASQISDFTTSVTNNAAMLANTAKNNYPAADAAKLAGIATGAQVNVKPDWNAASGNVAEVLNKPTITGTNTGDQDLSGLATTTSVTTGLNLKVDKVTGKGLSSEDYTTAEKTKLTAITGTNTGDNATNTQYSGLDAAKANLSGAAFTGAITATNLSGTNTGDQTNIPGNAATVTTNANLTGEVTSAGNAATVTNAAVIGKLLTGYTSGAGTVAATDNILQAIQKLNGNIATGTGTMAGDVTGTVGANVVGKINGTSMADLSTGILKNTTTTGVPSIAVAGDFPTLNQNTTGTASGFTGSLAGEVTGTQGATTVGNTAVIGKVLTGYTSGAGTVAATDNILQAIQKLNGNIATGTGTMAGDVTGTVGANVVGKINGTSMAGLLTGILKNTTTTGVPSIAIAGTDYLLPTGSAALLTGFPTLNQNTTGNAATATLASTVTTNANLTGMVTSTGNAATVVTNANLTGPITSVGNATTIANNAVTYVKMQAVTASRLLGNPTASAAVPSEITIGSGLSLSTDGVLTATAADGSETKVTAGNNVTVTGAGTTGSPYVVNATGATTLTIGQSYQGGKIFWLDATGQHGLIVATVNQGESISWYNGTNKKTGATGDGLYAGAMNTAMIVATQIADGGVLNFAAKLCADYSVNDGVVTYGDWYLPSFYELGLLKLQQATVLSSREVLWSSTEDTFTSAYGVDTTDASLGFIIGKNSVYSVRAIRSF